MPRVDHGRHVSRDRMRRQGAETIGGEVVEFRSPAPRPQPSKAALRRELADATAKITRTIKCGDCGHSARIAIPPAKVGARLRCSRCGGVGSVC